MKSLKKRMVILATAALLVAGSVVPAMAQDNPNPTPGPNNQTVTIISINIGGPNGWVMNLSIPVRCGNSC